LITIHNAENWLGLDEEGGGVGGPCDSILLPRPPALSPVLKSGTDVVASAAASLKSSKFGRSDTPGVNCINILCAAFARAEPKSVKKTVKLSVFLSFRDLRAQKLRINMLVKMTPGDNFNDLILCQKACMFNIGETFVVDTVS